MRSRLLGLLPALLLGVALLAPSTAFAAPADTLLLATEAEGEGEGGPLGRDPAPPDATDNPAAPEEYEANFLWGAAVGLLALTALGIVALGVFYYLLVMRPTQNASRQR